VGSGKPPQEEAAPPRRHQSSETPHGLLPRTSRARRREPGKPGRGPGRRAKPTASAQKAWTPRSGTCLSERQCKETTG
jgi:hypothetical protein